MVWPLMVLIIGKVFGLENYRANNMFYEYIALLKAIFTSLVLIIHHFDLEWLHFSSRHPFHVKIPSQFFL